MEIPKLEPCTNVCLIGPVASGKSWLLEEWFAMMERGLFCDATAQCLNPAYTHVWRNPAELCEVLERNPYYYRIAYHANHNENGFYWCASAIWTMEKPRWLIVDEVHLVCGVHGVDETMNMCIRLARHNFLGLIGASQRMADVSRLFTDNCRMIVHFHTSEPRSLDAVAERLGNDVAKVVEGLRPCIYNDASRECLQHPECLVWIRGKGYRVFSLGDKVQTQSTEETEQWNRNGEVQPLNQPQPSLEENSGESAEPSLEVSSEQEFPK